MGMNRNDGEVVKNIHPDRPWILPGENFHQVRQDCVTEWPFALAANVIFRNLHKNDTGTGGRDFGLQRNAPSGSKFEGFQTPRIAQDHDGQKKSRLAKKVDAIGVLRILNSCCRADLKLDGCCAPLT